MGMDRHIHHLELTAGASKPLFGVANNRGTSAQSAQLLC